MNDPLRKRLSYVGGLCLIGIDQKKNKKKQQHKKTYISTKIGSNWKSSLFDLNIMV